MGGMGEGVAMSLAGRVWRRQGRAGSIYALNRDVQGQSQIRLGMHVILLLQRKIPGR